MASVDSGYFESHLTSDKGLVQIAGQMYAFLCGQDGRTIELPDFVNEIRDDYDLRSSQIDEIIRYMISVSWVQVWKESRTGEMWITAMVIEEGEEGSEASGGGDGDGAGERDEDGESESGASWP